MSEMRSQTTGLSVAFEKAIDEALEQQITPAIPVDFAARVAAKAAMQPQRSRAPRAHYARTVATALSAVLVITLFVLAPHAQPSFSSVAFDLELTTLGMLCALVFMLTQMRDERL